MVVKSMHKFFKGAVDKLRCKLQIIVWENMSCNFFQLNYKENFVYLSRRICINRTTITNGISKFIIFSIIKVSKVINKNVKNAQTIIKYGGTELNTQGLFINVMLYRSLCA